MQESADHMEVEAEVKDAAAQADELAPARTIKPRSRSARLNFIRY
jgi:hypothetical protein